MIWVGTVKVSLSLNVLSQNLVTQLNIDSQRHGPDKKCYYNVRLENLLLIILLSRLQGCGSWRLILIWLIVFTKK